MEREILTVEQAADYLQVTTKTVYNLIEASKIKASKVGRVWRIKKVDIEDYLTQNSNKQIEKEN